MQAFRGEEMIHQFSARKYRIDLYIPKYKLAIECDEFDHRDRDIGYEVERQKHIEKLLNCTFVRFNPDAKDFCILEVVNKIFVQVKILFKSECLGRSFLKNILWPPSQATKCYDGIVY